MCLKFQLTTHSSIYSSASAIASSEREISSIFSSGKEQNFGLLLVIRVAHQPLH
jgi:hypothetical protein